MTKKPGRIGRFFLAIDKIVVQTGRTFGEIGGVTQAIIRKRLILLIHPAFCDEMRKQGVKCSQCCVKIWMKIFTKAIHDGKAGYRLTS